MYIRDMPFSAQAQELTVHGEKVTVFAFEPIVWVSITPPDVTVLPDDAPKFPAIVDTGNVVAFNIRESQLTAWTRPQLRSADLSLASPPRPVHDASGNVHRLPRLRARVWLHPYPEDNGLPALDLQVLGGILVYETLSATQEPPRAAGPHLPLLGARAFRPNGLKVDVDYRHLLVNIGDENLPTASGWLLKFWEKLWSRRATK